MVTRFFYNNKTYYIESFDKVDNGVDYISTVLRDTKTFYEKELLEYIRSLEIKGAYLDIGANIGNHSVYFACETKCQELHCFEPYKDARYFLNNNISNIKKMSLASKDDMKIVVYAYGLSDSKKTVPLYRTYHNNVGANSVQGGDKKLADIELQKLDDVDLALDYPIGFMKLDVESHEIHVLEGAKNTILTHKPIIYTEIRSKQELRPIIMFMSRINYKPFYNKNEHYLWKKA